MERINDSNKANAQAVIIYTRFVLKYRSLYFDWVDFQLG